MPVQQIHVSLCPAFTLDKGVREVRAKDCPLDWADGGSWLWKAFSSLESNVAVLWRRAEAQSWLLQRQDVSSPLEL